MGKRLSLVSVPLCLCASVIILFLGSLSLHAQTDCDWTGSSCTDPWVPNPSYNIWVQISSSPACSVMVRIASESRCNEINVIDFDAFIWVANPTGCASPSDISNSITAGVIKEAIYQHLANVEMFNAAMDPNCCPCPIGQQTIVSKIVRCHAIALNWIGGNGSLRTVEYDPAQPWSVYQNMIDMSYGFNEVPSSANPYF